MVLHSVQVVVFLVRRNNLASHDRQQRETEEQLERKKEDFDSVWKSSRCRVDEVSKPSSGGD